MKRQPDKNKQAHYNTTLLNTHIKPITDDDQCAGQDLDVVGVAPDRRGAKFDSSLDRGQPFVFMLGAGRVIRGWDDGIDGMRVGGRRVLHIPADLAYGARGAGAAIPPGASLVFEVELLDVRR